MRDYGRVFSAIWASEDFRALTEDGRALVLYLLTCQHGTLAGVFRLPDGYVSEDLQWGSERVAEGFRNVASKGFATRCEGTKWVWIGKYLEWNPLENPNQRKAAAKLADKVPAECQWRQAFISVCGPEIGLKPEPKTEPLPNPLPTVPEPVLGTVTVTGEGTGVATTLLVAAKTPRPSRKAPESFLVEAELQAWAREKVPGLDIRAETEKFRDHTFKTAITDWPGAWRNWMRNAAGVGSTAIRQGFTAPASRQTALEANNAAVVRQLKEKLARNAGEPHATE